MNAKGPIPAAAVASSQCGSGVVPVRPQTAPLGNQSPHLLDRELPEGYMQEWSARISAPVPHEESGTRSVLILRVGVEWFAWPTAGIVEIVALQKIHSIPRRSNSTFLGLTNVRGELLLCASLAGVLGLEPTDTENRLQKDGKQQWMVVVQQDGRRLVFPVQQIEGVARYHPRELQEIPTTLAHLPARYSLGILSWGQQMVACLDDGLVFYTVEKGLS